MKLEALTVIGLNSGTSMDGVDAAVFRITPLAEKQDPDSDSSAQRSCPPLKIEMLGSTLYEFEPSLREKMKAIIGSGQCSLDDICRLDAALGESFALAIEELLNRCKIDKQDVDLIGSHGQTLWHAPQEKSFAGISCANTLQLGQAAIIAERTNLPVVADFRVQDMAAGGQGAPLVSFADEVLFAESGESIGVLNIGGIANLTVINKDGNAVMAFDTGPGNMLIDRCAEKFFGKEYDNGGALAEAGTVAENWLEDLLCHPYYSMKPPKTTGRELFGITFADSLIEEGLARKLSSNAIIATLSALTAASIARQYQTFIRDSVEIKKLILGGGGAENKFLVSELHKRWPHELAVAKHEDYGISTKFKEALLFALLAYTSYFQINNNVPACTGARRPVCMGKLSRP